MSKVADEYRKKAEAAERSARKARTDFEKQGFLRIAKGLRDLEAKEQARSS